MTINLLYCVFACFYSKSQALEGGLDGWLVGKIGLVWFGLVSVGWFGWLVGSFIGWLCPLRSPALYQARFTLQTYPGLAALADAKLGSLRLPTLNLPTLNLSCLAPRPKPGLSR